VGYYHLGVCLCAQSSRLKKWLFIPNTSCVNIESCFDVIDCIHHEVKAFPEGVVKDNFSFRSN
jgi:hypothetical protein